jgi:hypothetical protein
MLCLFGLAAYIMYVKPEPREQQATGNLASASRIEYLYVIPAVEVVASDQTSVLESSLQK